MKKLIILISLSFSIFGCATNSTIFRAPLDRDTIDQRVENSPIIQLTGSTQYTSTSPEDVNLHFKKFHILNRPDKIINWEFYYVMGEPSLPSYEYEKIAFIEVYLPEMDDGVGEDRLREAASSVGATALVDVYKKPISSVGATKHTDPFISESPIDAYLYYGMAVREM